MKQYFSYLDKLENECIFIIREAYYKFKKPALLWSIGKDSTSMLWLVRKAFFGKIPFPVIHIDTTYKFKEIYKFRDELIKKWKLELIVLKNDSAISKNVGPKSGTKYDCCKLLKTDALKKGIDKYNFDALFVGIRRDEHGIRAKERTFSPRKKDFSWNYENQPAELWDIYKDQTEDGTHIRIHPILNMTELNVWEYIRQESIPVCPLYFSKNGNRYRSIGCQPCCSPVVSTATTVDDIVNELNDTNTAERSGRAQDKEDIYTMQKLRSLGYM